ncbi:MAG: DUF1015 domain-containing protein [Elusimicrobia bacterium]|nr:DUF1015 domain-containing protein [Elusimicrobiota bacterium]
MPEIFSFYAIRYNRKDISDLVCPPYDVISPPEKELFLKKSSYNAVAIELPESHKSAKEKFEKWKEERVLIKEESPSFYLYEQTFYSKDKKYARIGFFALLKTEKFGKNIFPHEKTLSAPKVDRLELLKATKINTSPIFCLFSDTKNIFKEISQRIKAKEPNIFVRLPKVFERVWIINDLKTINSLKKLLKNNKILIADGHHRYETFHEFTNGGNILSFLCPFEDKGLLILPTHRLIKKWKVKSTKTLSNYFKITKNNGDFKFYMNNKFINVKVKKKRNGLPIEYLHSTILKDAEFSYTKDEEEAIKRVDSGEFSAAVILNPLTIKDLKFIVRKKMILPQKSTYFYPKVSTGIVFNELG